MAACWLSGCQVAVRAAVGAEAGRESDLLQSHWKLTVVDQTEVAKKRRFFVRCQDESAAVNWHQKHWRYWYLSTCWAAPGGCSWDGTGFDC